MKKYLKKKSRCGLCRKRHVRRFTKRYRAKLEVEWQKNRAADFCAHWWEESRKQGCAPDPAPDGKPFGLSPQMADVLHRACLVEWKGQR